GCTAPDPAPTPSPSDSASTAPATPSAPPAPPDRCDGWSAAPATRPASPEVADASVVGRAWAGMEVGQALLTTSSAQYVAYYDTDRRLVVAQRTMDDRGLPSSPWTSQRLDTTLGWDSHAYATLAVDRDGALHVAGNMHVSPLTYFRSDPGGDVRTLERVTTMVDESIERRVTYPDFLLQDDGSLLFSYRDGDSTDGATYLNRYDEAERSWRAVTAEPLVDGSGDDVPRNAYVTRPVRGPDGFFHVLWVWRRTGDVATNSVLTYAKTKDFETWRAADGTALDLPLTYREGDIVDPVPEDGGLINGVQQVGFDAEGRLVVVYPKFDDARNLQLWAATPSGGGWDVHQLTHWDNPVELRGEGTLAMPMGVGEMQARDDGTLAIEYTCHRAGGTLVVDDDLRFVAQERRAAPYPRQLQSARESYPGLAARFSPDLAPDRGQNPRHTYVLRWESLAANQDEPRDDWPRNGSELTVVRLR
ncbi:hypothetical protein E4U02_14210, partial [Microbacterium paludicola]